MLPVLSEKGSLSVLDIFKMKKQYLSTEKNKFLELSKVLAERLARAIFLSSLLNTVNKMPKVSQNVARSKTGSYREEGKL